MKAELRLLAVLTTGSLVLTACMQEPEPADMTPTIDVVDNGTDSDAGDEQMDGESSMEPEAQPLPRTVALLGVAEPQIYGDWFVACNEENTCETATFVRNNENRMLFAIGRTADAEGYYFRFSTAELGPIEGPFGWVIEDIRGRQFRSNSYDATRYASNHGDTRDQGYLAALEDGQRVRFALLRENRRYIYDIPTEGYADAINAVAAGSTTAE
ncbi:hypothetical protein [Hyphobacterium sp.]|uniref:hypothetical protein n=1 Tax=Hyphobacterium sp. TaxID=2004662 RepID=UPI003BABE267